MSSKLLQGFSLGPWKVEPLRGMVAGPNRETRHLEPKVMDIFVCLAEHANELVTRGQLLDAAWSGNTAFEEQLTRVIGELRRALDDDPSDPKYIETVPKRGYRLIGEIRLADGTRIGEDATRFEPITGLAKHKVVFITAGMFLLALIYIAFDEFGIDPAQEEVPEMSVAVLPFVNMSADPEYEYFADGLSDEILTLLSKIPGLKVIGRTSSFSFKGKNEDLRVIGQTLGVKMVLEGSVRLSGDRVRITAQLIDVSDGTHIWSDSYDQTMTDIFAVQDEVAASIIDAMQIHVSANPTRGRPTENTVAYSFFLKAKAALNVFSHPDAEEALLKAVELDPNFAEAYELLAYTYWRQTGDIISAVEGQKLTGEAAAQALAIDPDRVFAQALHEAGNIDTWSYLAEIEAFEHAAREHPNNPAVLNALVFNLLVTGYLQEALRVAERFVDLDPLSGVANIYLFFALNAVGRTSEALVAADLALEFGYDGSKLMIGELNLADKQDESAISHYESYLQQYDYPDSAWVRELVTGARNPINGQAYLDRRVPQVVASMPRGEIHQWQLVLTLWYLFLGFLDQYFELIIAIEPVDGTRSDADNLVFTGTMYRRLGFTAHPKYLEVAETLGIIDVWEQRGPPDFCEKVRGEWVCE